MNAHHLLGERLVALGELERGEGHLRETLALGKELGVEGFGVATESVLAVLELERGARVEAERLLEAAQRTVEAALPFMRYLVAPAQGERLMRQGCLGEARDVLEKAVPEGRVPFHILHEPLPVLARARLAGGDREGAVAALDRWLEAWSASTTGPSFTARPRTRRASSPTSASRR